MTNYIVPGIKETLLAVQGIASSGRIILDNSAVLFPIGVEENGKLADYHFFNAALNMAVYKDDFVFLLMKKQKEYVEELTALANENKIFTIEEVVRKEMRMLKERSERSSHLFNFTEKFNESMKELEEKIKELMRPLRRNITAPARPYIFERIKKKVDAIRLNTPGKPEPSPVDREIITTAIYSSCVNRKRINVLTYDGHLRDLVKVYNEKDVKDIKGDVHCFMFDRKNSYAITEVGK